MTKAERKEFEQKVHVHAQRKAWSIAHYLCGLLQEKGWTASEFAKKSDVNIFDVKEMLSGQVTKGLLEISRVEVALGTTILGTPEELELELLNNPERLMLVYEAAMRKIAEERLQEIHLFFESIDNRFNFIAIAE